MATAGDKIRHAMNCLEREAYGRAEMFLKESLAERPDDAYLHAELVWCFGRRSTGWTKWRACDDYYQATYSGANQAAIAHFVAAEQFRHDERYPEARKEYRKAQQRELTHPAVDLGLARVLRAMGDLTEARNTYESVMKGRSCFLPALHEYAVWEFSEGNFRTVLAIGEKVEASEIDSECEATRSSDEQIAELREFKRVIQALEEAVRLQDDGRSREALQMFWPVFQIHKMNCSLIRAVVLMFVRADWLVVGTRRMGEAFPGEETYDLYAQGQVAWRNEKEKDALEAFTRAIDKGLGHPLVLCARAVALATQARGEEAEKDLLKAHEHDPHSTFARVELAKRALNRDDHKSVLRYAELSAEELEDASRYDVNGKQNIMVLECLALKTLLRKGKKQQALIRAQRARVHEQDDGLRFMKGIALAANGLNEDASNELSKAIGADARVVGWADTDERSLVGHLATRFTENYELALAEALFLVYDGDMETALATLTKLAKRFEHKPSAHLHQGRVAWLLGQPEVAEAAARKALVLDPTNEEAQIALCGFLLEQNGNEELLEATAGIASTEAVLTYVLEAARRLQDQEQERAVAVRLAELYPGNGSALSSLLKCSEGDTEATTSQIARFCKEQPLDFEVARHLCYRLLSDGQTDRARPVIERSISLGDSTFQAILYLGLTNLFSECIPGHTA